MLCITVAAEAFKGPHLGYQHDHHGVSFFFFNRYIFLEHPEGRFLLDYKRHFVFTGLKIIYCMLKKKKE